MKKRIVILMAMVLTVSICLAGCGSSRDEQADGASGGKTTFTDDRGQEVTVENPQKVAALSGSLAHIWILAGGELTCVTEDALEDGRLELDDQVVDAGRLPAPSAETIIGAGTDFALLTSTISGHLDLAKTLEEAGITTACFEVETFEDYLNLLDICTDLTGRKDLYEENGTSIQGQIDEVIDSCEGEKSPKVLLIRAYGTGAKAKNSENNMVGVMLKDLGCSNIADSDDSLLENVSMEKIIQEDPDFIFVTTMGGDQEALDALAENLTNNPAWNTLTAVKEDHYVVLPTELFHYKPNDRWGESYEMLAEILYGEESGKQ
ncbi:MAG: ABC transporter substrate-binding protein [Bacillota bacterium]|nr:ABC transporter substrate-binding protein [Bacillota bacterium]